MNLVFYDRRTALASPPSLPLLTIEHAGAFSFTAGLVASLSLQVEDDVALAKDQDTGTWYLVLHPAKDFKPFVLRPRDAKSHGLMFTSSPQARLYFEAHGLKPEKSVRAAVSLQPLAHEQGMRLYALTPQHPTKVPAVAAPVVAEQPVPELAPVAAAPVAEQTPKPVVVLAPVAVAAPGSGAVPKLTPGVLPESRAEQLADYWYEKEIEKASAAELQELLKVLGNTPKPDRGFKENIVLGRAKTENAARNKKGGKRG